MVGTIETTTGVPRRITGAMESTTSMALVAIAIAAVGIGHPSTNAIDHATVIETVGDRIN